ncbi:hypothetical protein [uncultured Lacinutrix sp.]|uniref:hypothetical protein n=1 Tax=uncultured Lacinutrix sp. TaxID=574032 RepID=UPI0026048F95|nr:hypothetical protein [uncultured Lacinutrix sp.]
MSKTIKQNLFRFVTLRSPQLIEEKDKDPGFIYHPDESKSNFFDASNADEKEAALKAVSSTFSALKNRKEVKDVSTKLYEFSSWLMRNKNTLSYDEIKSNSIGAEVLTTEQELVIWDNLIYQTIEKTSVYAREALIQVLITNKFLKAFLSFSQGLKTNIVFTEDQEKDFLRRANASVVLPKALFFIAKAANDKTRRIGTASLSSLEDISNVALAKYQNETYNTLLEELKTIEVKYQKESQKAYNEALNNHNKTVELLIAESEPIITEETDIKTGIVKEITTYPDLKLPRFDFPKEEVITDVYLKDKLSEASLMLLNKEGLDVYNTFEEVFQALKSKINSNNQIIFNKSSVKPKNVKIGGSVVKVNDRVPLLDYNFPNFLEVNPAGLVSPFMVFYNVIEPIQISSMTYTVDFTDGTSATDSGFNPVSTTNNMIRLFPNGMTLPSNSNTYTISGEITLLSGEKYSFTQLVNRKSRFNMGTFELVDTDSQPSNTDTIFGVTNIGIADFRRVEQEVCCYVPGEVSHIENVLAREYKERSTRSLTSVETTSETTSETEVENLTDTTTTERNEMQSEIASVINEDESKNYGASANASYDPTPNSSINIGGYADFSSSNSTSNSNSQALTYAQEVTERAMERIVTKTQTKRTSRILKEFEENNKHGFDNTKGDKHVTGVYRWVDKIYKNKLINYGKRLMYEFAIPEPARFLKDALWKKIKNNEEVDSAVVLPELPVHPKDYEFLANSNIKITDASMLTVDNYQELAAQYNADVNAIDLNKTISESFSATGNDYVSQYNHPGASHFKMSIPEGYMATSTRFNAGFVFVPKKLEYTYATVSVANHKYSAGGRHWDFVSNTLSLDNIENELAVSFIGADVGGIRVNVEAFCTITDQALKQWQNETYNAILNAYNERLREYNEAVIANEVFPTDAKYKLTFNPLHNRSLEKRELKRIAIELLIDQIKVSKDNYTTEDTIARVTKNEAFDSHASTVKFFEQAFDWEIMAYTFYPYFYAKQEDWTELFQSQDAADPLFQAFLQSGMARTIVPIRPGFEDAVNWYMSTGEIWNGQGLITDQDDDLYISVAEEMQTIEGEVEGTWETRLPTALTIVQADSALLDEAGLPCFCEDETLDNTIQPSTDLIGGEKGVGSDEVAVTNTVR